MPIVRSTPASLAVLLAAACGSGGNGAERVVDAPAVVVADAWAAASNDVWAVGRSASGGIVSFGPNAMRYDGATWQPVVALEGVLLLGVWGAGAADVWAVGEAVGTPILLHYDGVAWTQVVSGIPPSTGTEVLNDVSGSGPSDVWVVGYTDASGTGAALVHHFDGSAWAVVEPPPAALDLVGVHVTTPGVVWVLDLTGAIFRRDAGAWTRFESGLAVDISTSRLSRIGDGGDGTLFVGGAPGLAVFDGTRFAPVDAATSVIRGQDAILSGSRRVYTTFETTTTSCSFDGCVGGFSTREAKVHVDSDAGSRTVDIDSIGEPSAARSGSIAGAELFVNGDDLWVLGPSFWRITL